MGELTLNQKIGRRVAKFRNLVDLTQNQLSEKVQCSAEFLSRVERGACAASVKRLNIIAIALGIPLKALFDFDEESVKKEEIEEIVVYRRNKLGELIQETYEVYKTESTETNAAPPNKD